MNDSSLAAQTIDISRSGSRRSRKGYIFLSCRFADSEFVGSLIRLLKHEKFEVMTGGSASTFISQAILDRIKACDMFLCLMTRDELKVDSTYTTSPWLLQETGAAVALGKPLVLMVQDGVSGIGGLQADWQRIHFTDKTFLRAALDALQQLEFQSKRRRSHFAELATGSSKHGKAR